MKSVKNIIPYVGHVLAVCAGFGFARLRQDDQTLAPAVI
jgi:hypothetical protein